MHRTVGDGYITDNGKNYYADENLPARAATQLRHQEMNAIQEEIASVIEATGASLNADSETYSQMTQLNAAINAKGASLLAIGQGALMSEVAARTAADSSLQSQITAISKPRRYIQGFDFTVYRPDHATPKRWDIMFWSGFAQADNDAAKFIQSVDGNTMQKILIDGSTKLMKAWTAGSGGGLVDPSYIDMLNSYTVDTLIDSATLTDVASTTKIQIGDLLVGGVWAGYGLMRVLGKGATTITVDRGMHSTQNNVVTSTSWRWLRVFALGKSSDATAIDYGVSVDSTGAYFATQGWDLRRRIGWVAVCQISGEQTALPIASRNGYHQFSCIGNLFSWLYSYGDKLHDSRMEYYILPIPSAGLKEGYLVDLMTSCTLASSYGTPTTWIGVQWASEEQMLFDAEWPYGGAGEYPVQAMLMLGKLDNNYYFSKESVTRLLSRGRIKVFQSYTDATEIAIAEKSRVNFIPQGFHDYRGN